ncbi:hypothetical protein ACJA25_00995 [Mycoplasmopsis hyopharyngis]|uniref:hypothetical protein n=1 Tax=Mycoplasmopsis hyopharyngis TaxID=29558 RepID=UPI003872D60C
MKARVKKKLNIPFVELKQKSEWIEEKTFSIPIEMIKFLCLSFISCVFLLLQYQSTNNGNNYFFLRKIYLYSFGLMLGDITPVIIFGIYISLIIWWLTASLKKYYFRWFKKYIMVDYWILRKKILKFIWIHLLIFVIAYYLFLVQARHQNFFLLKLNETKDIYKYGWYYSFVSLIEKSKLPNATLNIGFFADSVLNAIYIVSFGPWLLIVIIVALMASSWFELLTLKPKHYLKNMNTNKKSLPMIEKYLKRKTSIFYYTNSVATYLQFCKDAANVLKIHFLNCSFNFLIKQINKNMKLLSNHSSTMKYFIEKDKKVKLDNFQKEEIAQTKELSIARDEDIFFDSINSKSLEKNKFSANPMTYSISSFNTKTITIENEFPTSDYPFPISHIETQEYKLSSATTQQLKVVNRNVTNALNKIIDEEDDRKTKEIYNIDFNQLQENNIEDNVDVNNFDIKEDEQIQNNEKANTEKIEEKEDEWISPII